MTETVPEVVGCAVRWAATALLALVLAGMVRVILWGVFGG